MLPGPACLKDTLQLSAFSGNNFFLGHAAMLVNEGLPNFIVGQLRQQHKLRDKVVAVLGMAFKSESDDKRESLSYKLRKLLMVEAREVLCTDPYVVDEKLVPLEDALSIERTSSFSVPRTPCIAICSFRRQGRRGCVGILAATATRNRRIFRIVKVLVTGASGFICGYLIQELLEHGYDVVGLDNFSKYGRLQKSYDSHPRYKLVEGDAKDVASDEGSSLRLRPLHRGRSHDWRYLLLSRICL